jgi:DNA-binding response OmpR family regulator
MRLLLVEDDKHLGKATAEGLRESFAVDWVRSAEEAEDAMATTSYDLGVFDINLPHKSGLDLLSGLRNAKNQMPVLLLTARDAVYHRVEGLNAGADDYLVKPFDLDELFARCTALIRRAQGQVQLVITAGDVAFEPGSGKTTKAGSPVTLSARERAIFDVLIHNIDRPVSKAKIEERIYDWGSGDIESNTIEVHISALRRKIGRDTIKTIRGVGYMICS